MKAGLIADIVVVILIILPIVFCTRRGFVRSLLHYASWFLALMLAIFTANPLANFFDQQFGWAKGIETWHIPFVSGKTLLIVLTAIAVFILARLLFILLDKLFEVVMEKLAVVNAIDRVFGFVFGIVVAVVELCGIFMLINSLSLQSVLQLTPESGGILAHHLFTFFKENIFPIMNGVFGAVSDATPKF